MVTRCWTNIFKAVFRDSLLRACRRLRILDHSLPLRLVRLPPLSYRVVPQEFCERVQQLNLGLEDRRDNIIESLSRGQRQLSEAGKT